jgi:hypothetical protein
MRAAASAWIEDARRTNNPGAATAQWYVTPGEMRTLMADLGQYMHNPETPLTFYGMPLKVIEG